MSVANRTTVVGVFPTAAQADKAVDALLNSNFTNSQIGVVSAENDHYRDKMKTSTVEGDQASAGAVTGAVAGAGIGGLIGLGVLAGVVPVIGPAIVAGTLGTILSNVALGAGVVGVSGALMASGISEDEAIHYEREVKGGRVVVTVNAGDRGSEAEMILNQCGRSRNDRSNAPQLESTRTLSDEWTGIVDLPFNVP